MRLVKPSFWELREQYFQDYSEASVHYQDDEKVYTACHEDTTSLRNLSSKTIVANIING